MIITLTPNTGIDHTLELAGFQLNRTIRAVASAWGMGGKPTDVSWILGRLGIATRALGFAAGPNGQRMERLLRERGVQTDFIWVDGETRLNTVIVVPGEGQSTITTSSLLIHPDHLAALAIRYREALDGASCVVLGGSLPSGVPPDFYSEAIDQAHRLKVPVIFDSSGPSLVSGVRRRPDIIKPNRTELEDLLGYVPASRQELEQAARKLRTKLGCSVIVTLGAEGAVAAAGDGIYFIHPVSGPVVSSAGAGDGVLAGMALAFLHRQPFAYGLKHGFALAGAILKTLATADFRVEDYQDLLPRISVEQL